MGVTDESLPVGGPPRVVPPVPSDTPSGFANREGNVPSRPLDDVIGDCGVYENGRRRAGRLPFEDAGRAAREVVDAGGFVWIGLQQPTAEEIAAVAAQFDLPHLAVEDAVKAHQRPKLETYDDLVFVILKTVRYVDREEVVEVGEIALFLGPGFVVTVRHGESSALRTVRAELDSGSSDLLDYGPTGVLYRAADLVVDGYEEASDFIDDDIDEIEAQVFGEDESDHAQRIYKLKREVAEFRRAVLPLAAPLYRLAGGAVPGVDKEAAPYFRDVHDHLMRAAESIEAHDRLLSDILQADMTRLAVRQSEIALRQNEVSMRQNEDMRKISAWAAIALVPTAVAGIYGMNFNNMPELRWRYGYFMVLGVIATICIGLYRLFRRNGWL